MDGLEGILEALEGVFVGVLEAMLSKNMSKKAQDAKTLKKSMENKVFWSPAGVSWRRLGGVLGGLGGDPGRLGGSWRLLAASWRRLGGS